ncbi:hypothetical protein SH467x_003363 [Pirellulaceae bacterium SH467]
MSIIWQMILSIGTFCYVANESFVVPIAGASKVVFPELVDGCEQVFAVEIANNSEKQIEDVKGTVSCGCLSIDIRETSIAANEKIHAKIRVRPNDKPIGQFIRFSGVVDSKDTQLGEVNVIAKVRHPYEINKKSFMVGEESFGACSLDLKPSDGIEIQKIEYVSDSDAVKAIWAKPFTVSFSQKHKGPYDHRTIFPNDFERSTLVVHFRCGTLIGKKSEEIVFSKPRRAQIFPSLVEARREEFKIAFNFLLSNYGGSSESLAVIIQLDNETIECDLTAKPIGGSKHFCSASILPIHFTKGQ